MFVNPLASPACTLGVLSDPVLCRTCTPDLTCKAVGIAAVHSGRAPWALSIVYRALVPAANVAPLAGKRIEALAWRRVDDAIADRSLAFDHSTLVSRAVESTRAEVERLDLPVACLPEQFTFGELQSCCGQLLGRRLDKSSFRRRLANRQLVAPLGGAMRTGANRPAWIYTLRTD